MAFTTQTFLFCFLPCCLILYYTVFALEKQKHLSSVMRKLRIRELVLILIGMVFYAWACFDDVFKLIIYIIGVWLVGTVLQTAKKKDNLSDTNISVPIFVLSISAVLLILAVYKYSGTILSVFKSLFDTDISMHSVVAPLGISFITFSAISYIADIYNGKAEAGNIIDCALYLSFFPKVISGPIVLWRDFKASKAEQQISIDNTSDGIMRIMIGFAKKLIIADTFGELISKTAGTGDTLTFIGVALLYMLQLYYDFSGYSDIALGLSSMLGYRFKENFDFPYLSCSITEFWRRWHISLGTWFKEYVYIPLGGNRKGKRRTIINILIVFLLTGIWHGSGIAFVLWGMIHGVCNALEKHFADRAFYKKMPKFIKWLCTMIILYFSWEIFRFGNIRQAGKQILGMLGIYKAGSVGYTWQYWFDARTIFLIVVAILGATVLGLPKIRQLRESLAATKTGYAAKQLVVIILFAISILFMVNSTYNPFLYFQF